MVVKISKTKFINYIRCNRFVALDEIYRDKTKAVVSFTDDPELEDLIGIENKEKVSSLLDSMYDEDEDEEEVDLLKVDDPQMEVMLPYYSQIEILAGQIIEKKYHGDVTYSLDTFKQRLTKEGRYIYDISYQRYVLEHSIQSKKQVKYYLVVLNAEYVHEGKINDKNEIIYGDEIVKLIDVTSLTEKMMPIIDQDVDIVLNRLDYMNANPVELGPHCQRKDTRQCMFYPICYKHLPEKNSIFTYMQNHVGFQDESGVKHDRFELINDGIVSALDLPREWLKRENNKIQRQVMESGEPFYHVQKIRTGISSLRYPIYHLDFETFPCPLPRFKGEVPYAQSLFQFSIHIEHAPGVCDKDKDNVSYIATKHEDLREELIIKMLDVIKPDGGSIMVYNQSFEQTRLKEMANIFPKYRERLLDMVDRLFDLMHLLRGNKKLFTALGFSEDEGKLINYYHNDLNGSFSIKKVLPLFSHLTYKGMPIANGTQALVAYAKFPLMDEKTFQQTYDDLLEYCKQDTWAMVEILDQLRKI